MTFFSISNMQTTLFFPILLSPKFSEIHCNIKIFSTASSRNPNPTGRTCRLTEENPAGRQGFSQVHGSVLGQVCSSAGIHWPPPPLGGWVYIPTCHAGGGRGAFFGLWNVSQVPKSACVRDCLQAPVISQERSFLPLTAASSTLAPE